MKILEPDLSQARAQAQTQTQAHRYRHRHRHRPGAIFTKGSLKRSEIRKVFLGFDDKPSSK
jgi:hypothetical protein